MSFSCYSLKSGTEWEFQEGMSGLAMFAPARSAMFAFSEQANLRFRLAEICFLLSFLCSVTKKGHQKPHSERVPKAQGERQKEKLLEAPTKKRPRITLAA